MEFHKIQGVPAFAGMTIRGAGKGDSGLRRNLNVINTGVFEALRSWRKSGSPQF